MIRLRFIVVEEFFAEALIDAKLFKVLVEIFRRNALEVVLYLLVLSLVIVVEPVFKLSLALLDCIQLEQEGFLQVLVALFKDDVVALQELVLHSVEVLD